MTSRGWPLLRLLLCGLCLTAGGCRQTEPARPEDFIALRTLIPDIQVELRYLGSNNFTGRPVAGYQREVVYLTRPAALALQEVQASLQSLGLGLKVYDGYRPQRAVDDFMRWTRDTEDTRMKTIYYPDVDKSELVPKGYIAERSGHSRGSTVDLTLIDLETGESLDMGSPYDFFGPLSWSSSDRVSAGQRRNRMLLRAVMQQQGFRPLAEEWWHFTLEHEPYPDRYFDFPVR